MLSSRRSRGGNAAAVASSTHGHATSEGASKDRAGRPRPTHHPVLLTLGVVYLVAHTGILVQQLSMWLRGMLEGQALTPVAHARLALVLHELVSLSLHMHIVRGGIYGICDAELADRCLIQLAVMAPIFQHLLAATGVGASADAVLGLKRWWGFQALAMALGAASGFKPSHSLVQAVVSGVLTTLRQCVNSCYTPNGCSFTVMGSLHCLVVHGATIQAAGLLAWGTAYVVVRKHKQRERLARQSAIGLAHESTSAAALGAGAGSGSGSALGKSERRPLSGTASKRSEPSAAGSPPAGSADAAFYSPAGTAAGVSSADSDHGSTQLLPLEFLGVHIFRRMGLGPFFLWLDEYAMRAAERMEEMVLVRIVCLPIAIYSLTFAVMARMHFMNYDYGCVSYDMLFLWMAAWFMLGRDSATFNITTALQHVQEQVAASLAALSRPRMQTVSELVDSARQQIAGGGEAAAGAAAVDDLKLLEPLGEGSFGKVYKGIWRGTVVAVKSMVLPSSTSSRRERMAIMEAAISSALSHPNILQTYTYSLVPMKDVSSAPAATVSEPGQAEGQVAHGAAALSAAAADPAAEAGPRLTGSVARGFEVCLLLEFMDLGTLRDALDRRLFSTAATLQRLDYCSVLDTAADIAKGMLHLHSLNIIHGDLKARNVLLKRSATDPRGFTSKISDFGLSQKMEAEETHVSKLFQGTPTHMAPEVLLHGTQSKAADVYAFGITMWELFTMGRPYQHVASSLLAHYVAEQNERPRFPASTPPEYVRLAQRCWSKDLKSRPSFQEIVTVLTELQLAAYSKALSSSTVALQATPSADAQDCIGLAPPGIAAAYQPAAAVPMAAAASRTVKDTLDRWLATSQESAHRPEAPSSHGSGHQGQARRRPGRAFGGDLPPMPALQLRDASDITDNTSLQAGETVGDDTGVQHILLEQLSQDMSSVYSSGTDARATLGHAEPGLPRSEAPAVPSTPQPPQHAAVGSLLGAHSLEPELSPGSAIVMGQRAQDDTWFDWQRKAQDGLRK